MSKRKRVEFSKETHFLICEECGVDSKKVSITIVKRICPFCVQKMVEPPKKRYVYKSTGRPRGWAFMKVFVDKDGTVFHRGKEQPKLKGTLPPTPRKKPKKRKRKKQIFKEKVRKEMVKRAKAKKKKK